MNSKARGPSRGFTYIGLLLVVAIMGIGLSVAGEVWHLKQKRDKEEELLFVGDQFRRAIGMYYLNAAGYPRQLEDLLKDPRYPETRRYLRRIYRDPITGRAEWGLVKSAGNAIIGVHSLSAQEPLKKTGFDLANQGFDGKTKYSEWIFSSSTTPSGAAAPQPGTTQPLISK